MAERSRGWSAFTKQFTEQQQIISTNEDPYPSLVPQGRQQTQEHKGLKQNFASAVGRRNLDIIRNEPQKSTAEDCSSSSSSECEAEQDGLAKANSELVADSTKASSSSEEREPGEDVYFKFRQDALRVSRAMSRHARAASNAYERGDHHRAKQLSKQMELERELAEKLNAQAASEIVKRNAAGRDAWTLDLHGLHAREAVLVLETRLAELEVAPTAGGLRYPDGLAEDFPTSSSQSSLTDMARYHEGETSSLRGSLRSWLEQRELKVITGLGVHSRNGASLPSAVKSFLINNNYRFLDDTRPGTIVVKLKRKFLAPNSKQ